MDNLKFPLSDPGQPASGSYAPSFQALIDAVPFPLFYKDTAGLYLGCNLAFERALGLTKDKITGKTVYEIAPKKMANVYFEHDRQLLETGGEQIYETSVVFSDSVSHDVIFCKQTFHNPDGSVAGLIGTIIDITERKKREEEFKDVQAELGIRVKVRTAELAKANEDLLNVVKDYQKAEEMLKKSQALYRAVVEDQAELICRFSQQEVLTFVNSTYCRYFGKTDKELLGERFIPFVCPADRLHVKEVIRNLSPNAPLVICEYRVVNAEGNECWLQSVIRALFDPEGNFIEYQVVGRDVTCGKRAEEELRHNEHFLSGIFSSIQDGISVLDPQMNIVRVNPAMEEWYRYAVPLAGKKCFEAYHSRTEPCEICPVRETLKTGESSSAVVPKVNARKEVVGWLELYSFPFFENGKGSLSGIIEYVRDITKRKKAEEELKKYRLYLENAIKERDEFNRKLRSGNRELRRLSLVDTQTGLYNRKYLKEIVESEFSRSKRFAHSFAVIMIDVRYPKLPDEHEVLGQCVASLKKVVRRYDTVIHLSKTRFAVISGGINRAQGFTLAQRLVEGIVLSRFGNKDHAFKIKAQAAVAAYPDDDVSRGVDLIDLAELRLFSSPGLKKSTAVLSGAGMRGSDSEVIKSRIAVLVKKNDSEILDKVIAFAKKAAVRDRYTGAQMEKAAYYAATIGRALGVSDDQVELLKLAALFHDIGKAGIGDRILLKKSPLTVKELHEVRRHPQIGVDIIRPVHSLDRIIPYVYYHHERWDGSGYPANARGEAIPVGARIIGLVDMYQALIAHRPYRKAYSREEAMTIIKKDAGTKFDPHIVRAFLGVLQGEK